MIILLPLEDAGCIFHLAKISDQGVLRSASAYLLQFRFYDRPRREMDQTFQKLCALQTDLNGIVLNGMVVPVAAYVPALVAAVRLRYTLV